MENKLSIREITKKCGIILEWSLVRDAIKLNTPEREIQKFKEKYLEKALKINLNPTEKNYNDLVNFLESYSNIINIDEFAFNTAIVAFLENRKKSRDFIIEDNSRYKSIQINKNVNFDEAVEYIEKVTKDLDVISICVLSDEFQCMTPEEFYSNRRKKDKNLLSLVKKMVDSLDFDEGIHFYFNYSPSDLKYIFEYPKLGYFLENYCYEKFNSDKCKDFGIDRRSGKKFDKDFIFKQISNYTRYINLPNFLIVAVENNFNEFMNNPETFDLKKISLLNKIIKMIEEMPLSPNNEFTRKSNPSKKQNDMKKEKLKDFDFSERLRIVKKRINNASMNFIRGVYYTDKDKKKLVQDIIDGNISIDNFNENDINNLGLEISNYFKMFSSSPKSFEKLLKLGFIDDKKLSMILNSQNSFLTSQIISLYKSNYIDSKIFLDLYLKSDANIEEINELKKDEEKKAELEELLDEEELIKLYLDPKKVKEFDKYRKLYKSIKLEDKNIEQQQEIANNIIGVSDELLEEERIFDLYKLGLIPIDTIVDYVGESAVIDLYSSGDLKFIDTKRMYESNIITIDAISKILNSGNLNDAEKLVLIYTTFSDEKYEKLREEILYNLSNVESSYKPESKKSKIKKNAEFNGNPVESFDKKLEKNYIMDPCAKWNFLASFDPECSIEYLKKDGHVIIHLPNRGKYFIEKLFDAPKANSSKPRWAYASATYLLSEDAYEKNKGSIFSGNDRSRMVNRTALVKLASTENSDVNKIIHTGWVEAVCREMDFKNESAYTAEQRDKIKECAERVKASRRLKE